MSHRFSVSIQVLGSIRLTEILIKLLLRLYANKHSSNFVP